MTQKWVRRIGLCLGMVLGVAVFFWGVTSFVNKKYELLAQCSTAIRQVDRQTVRLELHLMMGGLALIAKDDVALRVALQQVRQGLREREAVVVPLLDRWWNSFDDMRTCNCGHFLNKLQPIGQVVDNYLAEVSVKDGEEGLRRLGDVAQYFLMERQQSNWLVQLIDGQGLPEAPTIDPLSDLVV